MATNMRDFARFLHLVVAEACAQASIAALCKANGAPHSLSSHNYYSGYREYLNFAHWGRLAMAQYRG